MRRAVQVARVLGEGSFGRVYQARLQEETVAVKVGWGKAAAALLLSCCLTLALLHMKASKQEEPDVMSRCSCCWTPRPRQVPPAQAVRALRQQCSGADEGGGMRQTCPQAATCSCVAAMLPTAALLRSPLRGCCC